MSTQFSSDLRLARRKVGLTQRDVAHLLHTRISVICELEQGQRLPTLSHIVTLSIIFDRPFQSLFAAELKIAEDALRKRIVKMPAQPRRNASTRNRTASIERLARRLADSDTGYGAA